MGGYFFKVLHFKLIIWCLCFLNTVLSKVSVMRAVTGDSCLRHSGLPFSPSPSPGFVALLWRRGSQGTGGRCAALSQNGCGFLFFRACLSVSPLPSVLWAPGRPGVRPLESVGCVPSTVYDPQKTFPKCSVGGACLHCLFLNSLNYAWPLSYPSPYAGRKQLSYNPNSEQANVEPPNSCSGLSFWAPVFWELLVIVILCSFERPSIFVHYLWVQFSDIDLLLME